MLWEKDLPGRGLTKAEKRCSKLSNRDDPFIAAARYSASIVK